jgi:hypothetical protein
VSELLIVVVLLLIVAVTGGGLAAVIILINRTRRQRQTVEPMGPGPLPPVGAPQTVAPGWYDDGNGATRWHDGTRWTPHTR